MSEVITLPAGARIWLATGVTDMRCGFQVLAAKAQVALAENPLDGHVFVFRGCRSDLVQLFLGHRRWAVAAVKAIGTRRFIRPQADGGKISLMVAQLSMLPEGINWRQPRRTASLSML